MYIQRNNEARPCNHCYRGKAISVTYRECVFEAFGIQHVKRTRHIVICGLPGSTIFFHIITKSDTILEKEKVMEHKI